VLHLTFLRAANPDHRLLNLSCRVFKHRKILVHGSNNGHAARLAELNAESAFFAIKTCSMAK
jgi:hypothetical protein